MSDRLDDPSEDDVFEELSEETAASEPEPFSGSRGRLPVAVGNDPTATLDQEAAEPKAPECSAPVGPAESVLPSLQ
jgi:hypothetical protein